MNSRKNKVGFSLISFLLQLQVKLFYLSLISQINCFKALFYKSHSGILTYTAYVHSTYHGLVEKLTGCIIIKINGFLCGINPQESFVVVIFIPVERKHSGSTSFWVATEKIRKGAHQVA